MNLWTNEEIKRILLGLEEMDLPFKNYTLLNEDCDIGLIGTGGSANVYEVFRKGRKDLVGKTGYALKVIGFFYQHADSDFFKESIRAQEDVSFRDTLGQANVVKIYDHTELYLTFDEKGEIASAERNEPKDNVKSRLKLQFVLMEKLPPVIHRGKDLNIDLLPEALNRGDESEILKLAYDIGLALKHAHDMKILHRDVKLENVFYYEKTGQYKLGDFGIAKRTSDGFARTVAFTKGYAAPEVRGTQDNDRYDKTADIYSFGMMLFVLSNRLKFPDSETYNVNQGLQYSSGYTLPIPENEDISEEFYYVMERACMYDPKLRYPSMDEMLLDIEGLMYGRGLQIKKEHMKGARALDIILFVAGIASIKFVYQSWIPVFLISASIFLWLQFSLLSIEDRGIMRRIYDKGYYWGFVLLFYLTLILSGNTSSYYRWILLKDILNPGIMDWLRHLDVKAIGIAGLLFFAFWVGREYFLVFVERRGG